MQTLTVAIVLLGIFESSSRVAPYSYYKIRSGSRGDCLCPRQGPEKALHFDWQCGLGIEGCRQGGMPAGNAWALDDDLFRLKTDLSQCISFAPLADEPWMIGNNIHLESCNTDDVFQQFVYGTETHEIRSKRVFGIQVCLEEGEIPWQTRMVDCRDDESQKWHLDEFDDHEELVGLLQQYPACEVPFPQHIGDGICNDWGSYNTAECGWDGGDCSLYDSLIDCQVEYPSQIGDNMCQDWENYNTQECGWDGGDCDLYNSYPDCDVPWPYLLGDGVCNDDIENYKTEECGWDGGDCESPVIESNGNGTGVSETENSSTNESSAVQANSSTSIATLSAGATAVLVVFFILCAVSKRFRKGACCVLDCCCEVAMAADDSSHDKKRCAVCGSKSDCHHSAYR